MCPEWWSVWSQQHQLNINTTNFQNRTGLFREGAKKLQIFQHSSTDHLSEQHKWRNTSIRAGHLHLRRVFKIPMRWSWNLEFGASGSRSRRRRATLCTLHNVEISLDFLWLYVNTGKRDTTRWDDLDHLIVTFNLRNSLWDTDFRPWRFIWNVLQRPFDIHAPICAPIVYNISSWWDVDPKCFLHRERSQVPGQDGPMRKTAGSGTEAFLKPFESIMVTELQWQKP